MRLRVEYFWDEEAKNWGYRVPALHIVGGGVDTRVEAERQAIDAIYFALEGVESDYDNEGTSVEFFEVEVRPPARAAAS